VKETGDSDLNRQLAQLGQLRYTPDPSVDDGIYRVPRLNEGSSMTVLTRVEECRVAVNAVASTANRLISIFTPDLEPDLYDQNDFLDILKRFVLGRSFAKVRVLLIDTSKVLRDSNRFVQMGKRLSGCVEVRFARKEHAQHACSYLIADDHAIVYRLRSDGWDGVVDLQQSKAAKMYLAEFDAAWVAAAPDFSLRVARR
jgi:hypothetical protein